MRRLVLVGGGHAHLPLLHHWAQRPVRGAELVLVLDRAVQLYSGMLPGVLAGLYRLEQAAIDLRPLAARAGARLVLQPARAIDPHAREVVLAGGERIAYDVCSLDVGSTTAGAARPDVRAHAIPTRPVQTLPRRTLARLRALAGGGRRAEIAVVGAGLAGIELGLAVAARLRRQRRHARVRWIEAAGRVAARESPQLARRLRRAIAARGHRVLCGRRVLALEPARVVLEDRRRLRADLVLWCTGAAAPRWLAESGFAVDGRGFVRVRDTLEIEGQRGVFAAGDCAVLATAPALPRAGVYAVREAPVLEHNVRRRLEHGETATLRAYRPQRNFLRLISLGDRSAIGARGRRVAAGRWLWRLKDAIDRRFVSRYQGRSVSFPAEHG
ncbi:MAG: hypothetical protein D6776_11595 [Planctomycetota bacterium]|nr:MAG: hypothetical protein D6776_11595 [Planctomycetota bacterium]